MSSVIFYTQPTLYRSIVDDQLGGNTDTGYSITSMLDRSLDTVWRPTSSGVTSHTFLIDLYPQDEDAYDAGRGEVYEDATGTPPYFTTSGSSGDIDTFGVWLKTYKEYGSTIGTINYRYRLTAGGANGPNLIGATWTNNGENGLFLRDINPATTLRFAWVNLIFVAYDSTIFIPEVSHMFFLKKRTVQTSPRWPQKIIPRYYNKVNIMKGGRDYVSAEAGNNVFEFDQNFTFLSAANEQVFLDMFDDCRGQLLPMVYQPGTDVEDAYVCRLTQDKLNKEQTYTDYHKATLKFKTIAYKRSGDNF